MGRPIMCSTRGPGAGCPDGVGPSEEHRSEWAAICSIAEKFGCSSETLRKWVRQAEAGQRLRPGLTSEQLAELRELRRENREDSAGERDLEEGFCVFRPGGARPPRAPMTAFIDEDCQGSGSSRSALSCRSSRSSIGSTSGGNANPNADRPAAGGTASCSSRSAACGSRI